jgi:hypothetical protein
MGSGVSGFALDGIAVKESVNGILSNHPNSISEKYEPCYR